MALVGEVPLDLDSRGPCACLGVEEEGEGGDLDAADRLCVGGVDGKIDVVVGRYVEGVLSAVGGDVTAL